jgi:predicted DCC family thiol-disulfide oxidoreductase YuxK
MAALTAGAVHQALAPRSLAASWRRFWFPAVPVERVAVFRLLVTGFVAFDVTFDPLGAARIGQFDRLFWSPAFFARLLQLGPPPASLVTVVHVVLIMTVLLSFVGLWTRIALPVAAALYLYWLLVYVSYGSIGHGRITVATAMVALAIAPAGRAYSLDSLIARSRRAQPGRPLPRPERVEDGLAGWALRLVTVLVVVSYLSAAFTKLRTAGPGWVTGGALDAALREKGTGLGSLLVAHHLLISAFAAGALCFEATAWLLFVRGRARDAWCATGFGFHLGSWLLLNLNFLDYVLTYSAAYRLELGADRASAVTAGLLDQRPRLSVYYDGRCLLCVRTITLLVGLDWLKRLEPVDAAVDGKRPQALVTSDGARRHDGFYAFRRIARALPPLWPTLPLAYFPGVAPLGIRVYDRVAANRGRTGSCSVADQSAGLPLTHDR